MHVGEKLAVISDTYPAADDGSALKAAAAIAARLTGQPL